MLVDEDLGLKLTTIFREVFDEPDLRIHDGMTAKDVEEWDSMNHVNMIVRVEKEFGVKFTLAEVGALKNVGDLKALLRKHNV